MIIAVASVGEHARDARRDPVIALTAEQRRVMSIIEDGIIARAPVERNVVRLFGAADKICAAAAVSRHIHGIDVNGIIAGARVYRHG